MDAARGQERDTNHNHNGTSVFTCTQTPDQVHYPQRQPNPDRVTPSNSKTSAAVRYRECLRNHAASVGGNVFDGCGEFMPGGDEGTLEALKCAACDCHRNFHRKEVNGETQFSSGRRNLMLNPLQLPPPPAVVQHHQKFSSPSSAYVTPMSVAFGGVSGGTESSSEDINNSFDQGMTAAAVAAPPFVLSKKRFRTKFSGEQKEKMMGFAEKLGWRIQRESEEEVERFCAEVGVKRQVFKVWMHNNKNIVKKQQPEI